MCLYNSNVIEATSIRLLTGTSLPLQARPNTRQARIQGKGRVRVQNKSRIQSRKSGTTGKSHHSLIYQWTSITTPPLLLQVEDIECKLDNFIELYKQDRKRFLTLPLLPDNSHSNNPNLPPLPHNTGAPGGGSAMTTGSAGATAGSSGSLRVTIHSTSPQYVTLY